MDNSELALYLLDPASINVSGYGLGRFIIGYTDERGKLDKRNFLWLLVPVVGWIQLPIRLISHYLRHNCTRVCFFENGIVRQELEGKGQIKAEIVLRYDELKGISISKTRNYSYGVYLSTAFCVNILDSNLSNTLFMQGVYRNKNEEVEDFDMNGHILDTLVKQWSQKAIDKFNAEMQSQGYGVFYTGRQQVHVGKDFLRFGDNYVSRNFKYSFHSGMLNIFPQSAEDGSFFQKKASSFSINVNDMYNKEVFLLAINQFLGIK